MDDLIPFEEHDQTSTNEDPENLDPEKLGLKSAELDGMETAVSDQEGSPEGPVLQEEQRRDQFVERDDALEQLTLDEKPGRKKRAGVKKPAKFNFATGLTTILSVAFVVATLFTLWTPGSLVESSLEDTVGQVILPVLAEEEVVQDSAVDADQAANWDVIGIVAGHYGSDSGAVCANNVTEVELNLEIATLVQKMLSDKGYKVDLLQEFDSRLEGYQAAVLISIHLDSCEYVNELATGFKVASALSTQNIADSQRLTQCLSFKYGQVTGLPYHAGSVTDDMTYYHAFNEVDPRTVAGIIEAGFMNLDFNFLTDQTDLVAEGIVAGILCFLNNEPINP